MLLPMVIEWLLWFRTTARVPRGADLALLLSDTLLKILVELFFDLLLSLVLLDGEHQVVVAHIQILRFDDIILLGSPEFISLRGHCFNGLLELF